MAQSRTKGDKNIANFAKPIDAAAVRATEDTAGSHGLDVCMAGRENASYYLAWASSRGACEMLSSLATPPCTTKEGTKQLTAQKTTETPLCTINMHRGVLVVFCAVYHSALLVTRGAVVKEESM